MNLSIDGHRPASDERGQTLVEFALILPIFVLVLFGIFDLGRAVYAYNTVNNAAREAVRLAIVDQNVPAVRDRAVDMSVSLAVADADVSVKFLEADYTGNGTTNACASGGDPGPRIGCIAEVEVTYHYAAATPIISSLIGKLTLVGSSQQPVERKFQSP
jgi:Flp pilus assembly protein TadG